MSAELERFVSAHESAYPRALQEIQSGYKRSHWMWYIFPQIHGLGHSDLAWYYAIQNRQEAEAFLKHPVLGRHLEEISYALLLLDNRDPVDIFGYTDSLKLRSSMTLFYAVSNSFLYKKVLDKFYGGEPDTLTLQILQAEDH